MKTIETKIDKLIEESIISTPLGALENLLKTKWDWKLTPEIKEKFETRFDKIKKIGSKFEAWDTKKNRGVYLDPNIKAFVVVKDTGNQCGFLRGAVTSSKRLDNDQSK